MTGKIASAAMPARIKALAPSLNNLSWAPTDVGNVVLAISGFLGNEPLRLGLNIANQYFAPLSAWTELGTLETEAEIGLQLRPATLRLSAEGGLQQVALDGTVVELSGRNLIAFVEHLLALYAFWFTSPAFRHKAQTFFPE